MQIHELTALARQMKASDIHISQGLPLMFRIDGKLVEAPVQFDEDATRALIENTLDESHREALDTQRLDADFAIAAPDGTRSRVNVFYQQGKISATLRLLNDEIPTMEQLGLPPVLRIVLMNRRGLHHRSESVVAQRVHLAAAGAEVFQFLLSWELNLFLIGFLVTHMFPFFSVRSFRARFFLSNGTKKAPRAVPMSFS